MARKQGELKGMPDRDEVGEAAHAYLEARNALKAAKEDLDVKGSELVAAAKKKRRREVRIEGKIINISLVPTQTKITVKNVKQP